jgi:hypothetical protein
MSDKCYDASQKPLAAALKLECVSKDLSEPRTDAGPFPTTICFWEGAVVFSGGFKVLVL